MEITRLFNAVVVRSLSSKSEKKRRSFSRDGNEGKQHFFWSPTCPEFKKNIVQYVTGKSATGSTDVKLPLRTLDGFPHISNACGEKKLNTRNGGWSVLAATREKVREGIGLISLI